MTCKQIMHTGKDRQRPWPLLKGPYQVSAEWTATPVSDTPLQLTRTSATRPGREDSNIWSRELTQDAQPGLCTGYFDYCSRFCLGTKCISPSGSGSPKGSFGISQSLPICLSREHTGLNQFPTGWPFGGGFCSFTWNFAQSLSRVWLFATPWTAARQASPSFTISWSLRKLMAVKSVMPSNHLILLHPLLLLPSILPSFRVFSNESTLCMRWPKYWSFSVSIIPFKEIPGLIFRMDWLNSCK